MALLTAVSSFAQETRGVICGVVTDPSSAAVSGASVMVRNVDTNVVEALKTNQSGYYEAPLLIAGNYQIQVEAAGFRNAQRQGLVLAVGAHLTVDFQMEVGGASDAVTVTADAPLVTTDTLTSGLTVDTKTIMNVPWPGDNVMVLASLTAGVQTANTISDYSVRLHSGGPASGITVNGGVGGNEFSLDGASNQAGRGTGFNPPSEMIAAVRVETSGFDTSIGH